MLRKIKKAIPAVISAILCVTMLLGVTASAAEKKSVWSETKALTSAKYNSTYIKWAEKYSAKEAKNTVTFSKSRTKKFFDKYVKATGADEPQYAIHFISKEMIMSVAQKDSKMKVVVYLDGIEDMDSISIAMYITSKEFALLDPSSKEKMTVPIDDDIDYDDLKDEMLDIDIESDSFFSESLGISENAKGKYFKLKSGENVYYYEEFSVDGGKIGFLMDANGNPLAVTDGETSACFNISYTVKNSEFTVPSGYTEVDY